MTSNSGMLTDFPPASRNGKHWYIDDLVMDNGILYRVEGVGFDTLFVVPAVKGTTSDCDLKCLIASYYDKVEHSPAERLMSWTRVIRDRACVNGGYYPVSDEELDELVDIACDLEEE